jgi:two-component system, OmpR family, response regulator
MPRLLVVEDERKVASFVAKALTADGHLVDLRSNGEEALQAALFAPYDGVVLDIMLPGRDGLSIVRMLRQRGLQVPVLLLTARGSTAEKVEGPDAGANDYLPKPFALDELLARVRAMTRGHGQQSPDFLQIADLRLDVRQRTATRGSRAIDLSARDFRLLHHLLLHVGKPQSREMLLHKVWD